MKILGKQITRGGTVLGLSPNRVQGLTVRGLNWSRFDVTAFGAAGDGVTDDTYAIRAAQSAANIYGPGAVIYFPAGTYAVCPKGDLGLQFDACFSMTAPGIIWEGENRATTTIKFFSPGLTNPETNFSVGGSGYAYYRIGRGAVFSREAGNSEGAIIRNLTIDGNMAMTNDFTVGGRVFRCTCVNSTITSEREVGNSWESFVPFEGTLLRFGNTGPAEITPSSVPYYVINTDQDTFQIATSPGGEAVTLTDTPTVFYCSNGDGWDMTHKTIQFATSGHMTIDNCTFQNFAAEHVHGGGDGSSMVTLLNSTFSGAKGSMISVSAVYAENCIFKNSYNAFECYGRQSTHSTVVIDCVFENDSGLVMPGGLVYIGSPLSSLTVRGCTFSGFTKHLFLSEWAHNVLVEDCTFTLTGDQTPLWFVALGGIYPNDTDKGWGGYNNITIRNNTFNPRVGSGTFGRVMYWQINTSRTNWVFEGNVIAVSGADKFSEIMQEVGTDSLADRAGSIWTGNLLGANTGVSISNGMARDLWAGNTFTGTYGTKLDIFSWYTGGILTIYPACFDMYVNYSESAYSEAQLRLSTDIYPTGFTFTLRNLGSKPLRLVTDATRHAWVVDQVIAPAGSLNLIFNGIVWDVV